MTCPILSICIPTYNRATTLAQTLDSIVSQNRFCNTNDIEIIISDNCSSDNTSDIVERYVQKYGKKIKYFRNEINVQDKNFELALSHGRGLFLKLHNDTLLVLDGGLDKICNIIKKYSDTCPNIFFSNKGVDNVSEFSSSDDFLHHIGIMLTWIGGFGLWRSDFESLHDFGRASKSKLSQLDVALRMIRAKTNCVACDNHLFDVLPMKNKSGYNVAEVFGHNYMQLMRKAHKDGLVSRKTITDLKKKMLKHINEFYFDLKHEYAFQRGSYWKHMSDYHFDWYFYTGLAHVFFRYIKLHLRRH